MVEVDHARASSPEPTFDVIMWAAAVRQVPAALQTIIQTWELNSCVEFCTHMDASEKSA